MGTGVFRHRGKERQAATYWRRRFAALVVGLAMLALVAWALSGALNGSAVRPASADGTSAGGQGAGQAAGGSGPTSASAGAAGGSAGASGPAAGTRGHHQARAPQSVTAPAASHGKRAEQRSGRLDSCPPGDVVLSLSSSQNTFGPRELPVFDADVVSTMPRTCTFNVGAKYLTLVIRNGRTRIWGSADCVEGRGSLVTDLQRGVPTVLPISWDRETSSPGCEIGSAPVRAGIYTATVIAGTEISNTETFRLR